jgi:predicted ribosome quality control (RQC) complex YloA/Tae2 family protein
MNENMTLRNKNFELQETIKKDKIMYDMIEENYADLNERYQSLRKGSFMVERMNDELINKELSEVRTLRDELYQTKLQNQRLTKKNKELKSKFQLKSNKLKANEKKVMKKLQKYNQVQHLTLKIKPIYTFMDIIHHSSISQSLVEYLGTPITNQLDAIYMLNTQLYNQYCIKAITHCLFKP